MSQPAISYVPHPDDEPLNLSMGILNPVLAERPVEERQFTGFSLLLFHCPLTTFYMHHENGDICWVHTRNPRRLPQRGWPDLG